MDPLPSHEHWSGKLIISATNPRGPSSMTMKKKEKKKKKALIQIPHIMHNHD